MNHLMATTLLAAAILAAAPASAASVEARLSSREAYVGIPITLQVSVSDATDFKPPTIPEIDGCEVRSAGSPTQSSQITIINGRRTERRSVTIRYQVTPRREGTFEIPSFTMEIDQKPFTIEPQRFVVTKSVTGDLLFVEIEGGKERVFVGEPLDLNLKIWLKPFRDSQRNLTLSEGDMWNMISDQSSWGSFANRMKELAENGKRPRGEEVLRDDGAGNQRSYYLYEISATVYPKRPGQIDADDVQIVVNYPTSLGKSRSPFGSMFDDSLFGGRSPLSSMMNDDFFSSAFADRLTVASARPIVGEVSVDATEVMPVPEEGRPADYRGAVGRYRIVTHATPTTVNAGDPITLNIGIEGTGPMELVQAPPLYQQESLTADFKVADESLAGFVQEGTKIFSTTIRPRREGTTEIPPIRFSYFDPESRSYETVLSEPISITVNQAEVLALDAVVGQPRTQVGPAESPTPMNQAVTPDFTNRNSTSVLVNQVPSVKRQWWWSLVVAPPIAWLVILLTRQRRSIVRLLPRFRSASSRCMAAIKQADDGQSIAAALTAYIAERSNKACKTSNEAVGALRGAGMYDIASGVETLLQEMQRTSGEQDPGSLLPPMLTSNATTDLTPLKARAIALTEQLEVKFAARRKIRLLPARSCETTATAGGLARRSLGLALVAALLASSASSAIASDPIVLSSTQQQAILAEAGEAYAQATKIATTDSAGAMDLFQIAADKYQLLVDSGIRNGRLYANLGNAYLQSGELGRAIVNYERGIVFDPDNEQLRVNLEYASARVKGQPLPPLPISTSPLESVVHSLSSANESLVHFIGERAMAWTLAISSLVFWGLVIARTIGSRIPIRVGASLALAILIVSLTSITLSHTQVKSKLDAVIVSDSVRLHAGDGEQFAEVASIDSAQGHRVKVLGQRGLWTHVRTADDRTGWIPARDVERVVISLEQDESLMVANHQTQQLPRRGPGYPLGQGV